jgi:hypothetical protein
VFSERLPPVLEVTGTRAVVMKSVLIGERDGLRAFVVVLAKGDQAVKALTSFAVEQRSGTGHFTAICALLARGRRAFLTGLPISIITPQLRNRLRFSR